MGNPQVDEEQESLNTLNTLSPGLYPSPPDPPVSRYSRPAAFLLFLVLLLQASVIFLSRPSSSSFLRLSERLSSQAIRIAKPSADSEEGESSWFHPAWQEAEENSYCIELSGPATLFFASPLHEALERPNYDNAGTRHILKISSLGSRILSPNTTVWFSEGVLVYHTVPGNLYHWTFDTVWPLFSFFLQTKFPTFYENFPPLPAEGKNSWEIFQTAKSANERKFSVEQKNLRLNDYLVKGDYSFRYSDGSFINQSWQFSLSSFHLDRPAFSRYGSDINFLVRYDEIAAFEGHDHRAKFERFLNAFNFTRPWRLAVHEIRENLKLPGNSSALQYFQRRFPEVSQLSYFCFQSYSGLYGLAPLPSMEDLKATRKFSELLINEFSVIRTAGHKEMFQAAFCPHYWWRRLQCEILQRIKQELLSRGIPEDSQLLIEKSKISLGLRASRGAQNSTDFFSAEPLDWFSPQLERINIFLLNRPVNSSRSIHNIEEFTEAFNRWRPQFSPFTLNFQSLDSFDSMEDQIRSIACGSADIFIFVHGAGGASVQFLSSDSIAIEIAPPDFGAFYSQVTQWFGHFYISYDLQSPRMKEKFPNYREMICIGPCGKKANLLLPVEDFLSTALAEAVHRVINDRTLWNRPASECSSRGNNV